MAKVLVRKVESVTCPRCGGEVSYIKEKGIGDQVYVYAVHYGGWDRERKRPRTRECYLGPKHSYEYVSRLHEREGLTLKGLLDSSRVLEYLDAIIDYMASVELSREVRERLAERFEILARKLRGA